MRKLTRIAMWSGPRNLSTALMRSFESREDCFVSDEPLYGSFLKRTGIFHPMSNQVIQSMECDYEKVVRDLCEMKIEEKTIWYQKHMCHHILDEDDISWCLNLTNCFLIRHPKDMLRSYIKRREKFSIKELGLKKQLDIFNYIKLKSGIIPPVIEVNQLLLNPENYLKKLCKIIEIPFSKKMLKWNKGTRKTDGVWGDYWYENVKNSTGFIYTKPLQLDQNLPENMEKMLNNLTIIYNKLADYQI